LLCHPIRAATIVGVCYGRKKNTLPRRAHKSEIATARWQKDDGWACTIVARTMVVSLWSEELTRTAHQSAHMRARVETDAWGKPVSARVWLADMATWAGVWGFRPTGASFTFSFILFCVCKFKFKTKSNSILDLSSSCIVQTEIPAWTCKSIFDYLFIIIFLQVNVPKHVMHTYCFILRKYYI
jgi:hypothetical protein